MTVPNTSYRPSPELSRVVSAIRSEVDERTETQLDQLLIATGAIDTPLADPSRVAVAGGKRFRALCAYVGAACALPSNKSAAALLEQASNTPGISDLGAALEFYQACALVHDDIIDNSPTRRGSPAAHAHFASTHREQELTGDAAEFGRSGAILLGDFLLAAADESLATIAQLSPKTAPWVLAGYARMAGEVAQGQFSDMSAGYLALPSGDQENAVQAALDVATVKSARYSVVRPAQLGAELAGAGPKLLDELESILEPAGLAFQLRDDHLGVFGTQADTGKPTGIDIIEGKRTVLLALTWQAAPREERELLRAVYDADDANETDIAAVAEVMESRGREPHEALINALVEESGANLRVASLSPGARELLRYLTGVLTARDS